MVTGGQIGNDNNHLLSLLPDIREGCEGISSRLSRYTSQSSVQLFYFMTSRPLKASHIKTGVEKKVEEAKRYTLRHVGCLQGCFTIFHHIHHFAWVKS